MFAILLLSIVPFEPAEPIRESVDIIEVNHYFDDKGRHIFDQLVFYDWDPVARRHQVRAWRLLKSDTQRPRRCWDTGDYVSAWQDGDVLRVVRAPSVRESWTQQDPELVEREHLAKEWRADLVRPVRKVVR